MSDIGLPSDLITYLSQTSPLSRREAERLVREVMAYFDETAEAYAVRRHRELQHEGIANAQAFALIAAELNAYPVRSAPLSTRQVRRLIYG